MTEHKTYQAAFNAAVELARLLGRETGLLKVACPLARRDVYRVYTLPKPENRCGYELRCQIVRPDEPLMAESAG